MPQEELLLKTDEAYKAVNFQGANLHVPQEKMLLNMDYAQKGVNFQGANLHNMPDDEMIMTNAAYILATLPMQSSLVVTQHLPFL